MSTTFGFKHNGEEIPVAFRHGAGNGEVAIHWIKPFDYLYSFLPPLMAVWPLDNTAQGIYTLSDIVNLGVNGWEPLSTESIGY